MICKNIINVSRRLPDRKFVVKEKEINRQRVDIAEKHEKASLILIAAICPTGPALGTLWRIVVVVSQPTVFYVSKSIILRHRGRNKMRRGIILPLCNCWPSVNVV